MPRRCLLLLPALLLPALLLACADPSAEPEAMPADDSAAPEYGTIGSVERLDPALDALIPADAQMEILAVGHEWTEGPVWISDGGYLLYSDIPQNAVFRWREGEEASVWLQPAGFTGASAQGREPGSNGLVLDAEGRLVLAQHGDRRIARLDAPYDAPAPEFTTLADRYDGKRFNSPNDAAFHSSGALYFTDPPYGLPEGADDPTREIDFQGVYRLDPDGTVTLLTADLSRPNGIAFSPDEQTLYVANSDPERAIWMAYDVEADGSISNGRVFFDATPMVGDRAGLPDGLKVDVGGHLFATGPGGVLVFAPDGTHLGTLLTTQATANVAFGGPDRSTLYITADMYLLRIPTLTTGAVGE